MQTVVKTLKIRVKDKHASVLRRMARDVNAAKNIARFGLESLAEGAPA